MGGRWHIDTALYDRELPMVTALRCLTLRKGPDLTVRWDGGTGTTKNTPPGATAYISGTSALARLSDEQRATAENSVVEYAPFAFKWMSTAHSTRLGHTLETEGLKMPFDQLGEIEEEKIKRYPMIWANPKRGEKCE